MNERNECKVGFLAGRKESISSCDIVVVHPNDLCALWVVFLLSLCYAKALNWMPIHTASSKSPTWNDASKDGRISLSLSSFCSHHMILGMLHRNPHNDGGGHPPAHSNAG